MSIGLIVAAGIVGVLDVEGSDAETDGRCVAELASGVAALVHAIATMPSTIVATSPPSGRRPRLPPLATIRPLKSIYAVSAS